MSETAPARLFSYKLTNDSGFAPNPFWGSLTLATCKPRIRYSKKVGDWIAGFTSESLCGDPVGGERLVYLMKVSRKLSIADYFRDKTFQSKIPDPDSPHEVYRAGDNIYRPLCPGAQAANQFEQLRNPNHWDGAVGCSKAESRIHDISGKFVLAAELFVYFGRDALGIPEHLRPEIPPGQSANGSLTRDKLRCHVFIDFVFAHAGGGRILGAPHDWPAGDDSWSEDFNQARAAAIPGKLLNSRRKYCAPTVRRRSCRKTSCLDD